MTKLAEEFVKALFALPEFVNEFAFVETQKRVGELFDEFCAKDTIEREDRFLKQEQKEEE